MVYFYKIQDDVLQIEGEISDEIKVGRGGIAKLKKVRTGTVMILTMTAKKFTLSSLFSASSLEAVQLWLHEQCSRQVLPKALSSLEDNTIKQYTYIDYHNTPWQSQSYLFVLYQHYPTISYGTNIKIIILILKFVICILYTIY